MDLLTVVDGLGDVCRRLDRIEEAFDTLPDRLDRAFLRRDVSEAREAATSVQLRGIEAEQQSISKRLDARDEAAAADRRMVRAALLSAALSLLVGLALTITTILLSTGG